MTSNVMIVNFAGLGDGLIELPFLKSMEISEPRVRFFHTGGSMFDDEAAMRVLDLRVCGGIAPAIWRKFLPEHWAGIEAFAKEHRIRRIVSLRNLGPEFDTGYFAFKQTHNATFEFSDYPSDGDDSNERNIRTKMNNLLRSAGLVNGKVNPYALREQIHDQRPHDSPRGIGINIHAGSPFKCWPFRKWKELCLALIDFEPLKVFEGHGEKEAALASRLVDELESQRPGQAQLVQALGIPNVLLEIAALKCVVSTDSWIPHAASGLGTPSVSLYIVTSSRTWGPGHDSGAVLESPHLRECKRFSAQLGVCLDQYAGCEMVTQFGDGIDVMDVLTLVLEAIHQ